MMLRKVRETKAPTEDQVKTFILFGMKVKQLNEHLVACEMTDHLGNPLLVDELVGKLSTSYKREWVQFMNGKAGKALCLFNKFIQLVVSELAEIDEYDLEPSKRRDRKDGNFQSEFHKKPSSTSRFKKEYTNVHHSKEDASPKRSPSCWMCKQTGHTLNNCNQFQQMTVAERITAAEKAKLCKTCLSKFCHGVCLRSLRCEVNGCGKQHHTLVHRFSWCMVQLQRADSSGDALRTQVIYRTIPITLHYGENSIDITAFVDEGSSATLIDECVAEQLKADGPNEPLQITWTGNISRFEDRSRKLDLLISSQGSTQKWKLFEPRTVAGLMLPSQSLRLADVVKRYKHLADIPVTGNSQQNPLIVIGLNNIELFAALETRVGNPGEPVAFRSKIGWTIYGVTDSASTPHVVMNLHRITAKTNRDLHDVLGNQYKLEQMSIPAFEVPIAPDEKRAKDILKRTTKRIGNRFETGLLWRDDNRVFPDSYPTAEKRMQQLAKRLKKNPALESKVAEMIKEYERKGYAHKITDDELSGFSPQEVWYLPLNVVHNAKKPEKIRLVWDAASTVAGVSLNSMLLKGPDMLVPLPRVVCRFRERVFAFGGDLKEMYHQLRIKNEDKQAQRILFGSDTKGKPQVYVMDVATFGATCSPCSAQFVKNMNALEFSEQYPEAARAIIEKHYVDDYYDSVDTEAEAIKLAKQVRHIHAQGGFHIRNWMSNSSAFLDEVGERSEKAALQFSSNQSTTYDRVLGISWRSKDDVFCFSVLSDADHQRFIVDGFRPSKRIVLSVVMTSFDPVGLITPITIRGKMLIQDLWRTGYDWNSNIDSESFEKWKRWLMLVQEVGSCLIPRSYFGKVPSTEIEKIELHVFCDASETGFGAVAYFRAIIGGAVSCILVMSRAKVAPLKPMSIPRLELEAAILGVRLSTKVLENHSLNISRTYYWTDAKVVLSWIRSDPRRYKQFVGLRVGEILHTSSVEDWNWVPSKSNPADLLTKWGNSLDMTPESSWLKGPSFLYDEEENWPQQEPPPLNTIEDLRVHLLIHDVSIPCRIIDADRFSKWTVLVRAMACVFQFIYNCRKKAEGKPLEMLQVTDRQRKLLMHLKVETKRVPLQQLEYEKAERALLKMAQVDCFIDELKILMKNKNRPTNLWINFEKDIV